MAAAGVDGGGPGGRRARGEIRFGDGRHGRIPPVGRDSIMAVRYRRTAPGARIVLAIGRERFVLTGGGGDAWAADRRMDAGIVAAMRSAPVMTVSARDTAGRGFSNTWQLAGAASAMDATAIACARLR